MVIGPTLARILHLCLLYNNPWHFISFVPAPCRGPNTDRFSRIVHNYCELGPLQGASPEYNEGLGVHEIDCADYLCLTSN